MSYELQMFPNLHTHLVVITVCKLSTEGEPDHYELERHPIVGWLGDRSLVGYPRAYPLCCTGVELTHVDSGQESNYAIFDLDGDYWYIPGVANGNGSPKARLIELYRDSERRLQALEEVGPPP